MQRHWEEIAIDRESIKLSLNVERYKCMDEGGILHILTARNGADLLVGYFMAFILPHIHYQEAGPMAFTDVYYLHPDYRDFSSGADLFIEAERTLADRGVTKAYLSCKVHQDNTPLFERLGWLLSDKTFTKLLN
jgi:hypothetical protein